MATLPCAQPAALCTATHRLRRPALAIIRLGRCWSREVSMDLLVWALAGAILGWAGCEFLRLNQARGPTVSAILGAVGGVGGGQVLAPLFAPPDAASGAFNPPTLLFAVAAAAVLLIAVNLLPKRWGV